MSIDYEGYPKEISMQTWAWIITLMNHLEGTTWCELLLDEPEWTRLEYCHQN